MTPLAEARNTDAGEAEPASQAERCTTRAPVAQTPRMESFSKRNSRLWQVEESLQKRTVKRLRGCRPVQTSAATVHNLSHTRHLGSLYACCPFPASYSKESHRTSSLTRWSCLGSRVHRLYNQA